MRACARVALVLMALSASFGLAGCAAIDELKDTISTMGRVREAPERTRHRLPTICQTRPLWFHRKSLRKRRQARRQRSRTNQRANCNGRRALCFLQRNHRSPHPPRRRGRTKLRGNPRRPLRCDCALLFPNRRRREFFHAEIGHRSYARSVRGRHRAYLCCRLAILSAASKSAPAAQTAKRLRRQAHRWALRPRAQSHREGNRRIERRFHLR